MASDSMDRTSVEDFQQYHNQPYTTQTPKLSQPCAFLQPYAQSVDSIDHDFQDDHELSIAGSARQSSDADEAVFDISPHHSSPRTSHSDDDISVLSDSKYGHSVPEQLSSSPYTPFKTHSPFRNPSSVRAMQMDTTPPSHLTSPKSQRYNFTSPSRNSTPRSVRSHHSAMRSPSKISPTKKAKKEYPLVLLHVTLLPIPVPYSPAVMQSVLPGYILENWKLLQEKATDTVLERGILIPHPKEDYDLLEERLLESLELKLPRILKCGHFHLDDDDADVVGSDMEDYDSDGDADICDDCGRRIRDGRFGSGTGNKRWDIKLYAANGLMRSGAWGAAWREMERVDVEILPWMDEDMRRELESRRQEEEERILGPPQEKAFQRPHVPATMDDARMREIYGESPQSDIPSFQDQPPLPPSSSSATAIQTSQLPDPRGRQVYTPQQQQQQHPVPLQTLLRNYVYLVAQDRRNIVIVMLSVLVCLLALASSSSSATPPPAATAHHLVPAHHPVPMADAVPFSPLGLLQSVSGDDGDGDTAEGEMEEERQRGGDVGYGDVVVEMLDAAGIGGL